MQLNFGPVPEDGKFDPEGEGWTALREPRPWLLQALAIPLGLAMCGAALAAILLCTPMDLDPWLGWDEPGRPYVDLAILVLVFLWLGPLHELVHAFLHPCWGSSRWTIVGFWPANLLFYAHWQGEVTRTRFLIILIGPLAFWTAGPVLLAALLDLSRPLLGLIALLNALVSCGDMLGFLMVGWQVPRRAILRNKGYWTWWKIPEGAPTPPGPHAPIAG